jgi:peptidoglycan/LPS O-acetylase OafA/YrhL
MIKLKYRPEIDALRAIAVMAVIIYHAKIYFLGNLILPGGFLGVDIFFVISGYLISSLIFRELVETKSFSFKNFYERRARRILPALFLVILVSIPFAWKYILPTSFVDYAKSILYSIGFGSNFYFYLSGQLYGAESGLLKPLLHTWSLAIEEQYYIVFPLLFLIIYNYFKNKIIIIIFTIAISSLIFSEYLTEVNASLNFYILLSRSWELLIGTLIFLLEFFKKKKTINIYNNFFILGGLMLIMSSFFLFESADGHPNIKSIYPIMGVSLVIYFSSAEVFVTRLLSNRIIVGVGLISYSLYLWHYPIFAFSRIAYFTKNIFDYSLVALALFILSILTYFFIEKPFRSKKKINIKYFLLILLSVSIFLITISLSIIKNKGFEYRFPSDGKFNLDNLKYTEQVRLKKYELGNPSFISEDKKKILIFGNSHGRDFFNMFALNRELFPKYEFSMMDGQFRCLKFLNKKKLCKKKISKKMLDIFNQSDIFIISTRYTQRDFKEFEKIIQILSIYKKKIIITSNSPIFYFKNSRNLIDEFYYKNQRLPNKEEKLIIEKNKFKFKKNSNLDNQLLREISKKNNVRFLDKIDYICANIELKCSVLTDKNEKIHHDEAHQTLAGSKYFGRIVAEQDWLKID